MRFLYDFECDKCGVVNERFIDPETKHVICDECGHTAVRVFPCPTVALEGITGNFPSAADHWANIREKKAKVNAEKNAK